MQPEEVDASNTIRRASPNPLRAGSTPRLVVVEQCTSVPPRGECLNCDPFCLAGSFDSFVLFGQPIVPYSVPGSTRKEGSGSSRIAPPAEAAPKAAETSEATPPVKDPGAEARLERVRRSLEQGLDVNKTDPNGRTVLMMAAFEGYTEVVELLLDYDAEVDRRAERR